LSIYPRQWLTWLWKLPLLGIIFLMIFVLTGLFVFQPTAMFLEPEAAPSYFEEFQPKNPGEVLLFQVFRGIIWVVLSVPIITSLQNSRWKNALLVAMFYALVMAPLNLVPNGLPVGIRIAHALEVFIGNSIYGLVIVLLLCYSSRGLEQLKSNTFVGGL
jgi:hypothetical protein